MKLNTAMTEIVRIGHTFAADTLSISGSQITTVPAAKCLGIWWRYNLSAQGSVQENICKARKSFFAYVKLGLFQGHLINPLSANSIVDTCVLPTQGLIQGEWISTPLFNS